MRSFLPLFVLFAIRLTPAIAFQSIAVAAPLLMPRLGLGHAQLGLALGAFTLPGLIVSVPAGLLARRIGDRAVLAGGLLLVALGSALAAWAGSFPMVLGGRVLAGTGGVAVLMLLIKMTADRYAGGPWLSTASAVIITAWPAGLALGLVLCAPLPEALGWRGTLAAAGLPALLAILLVPLAGRGHRAGHAPASVRGHGPGLAYLVGAIATWGLVNAVLATMVGFLPGYLLAQGADIRGAASAASLAAWTPALCIPLGGFLADRALGRNIAVAMGLTLTAAMLLIIGSGVTTGMALVGFGVAFSIAPGPLTAQLGHATPAPSRAVVFGCYSGVSYAGMTLGPWLAGWLRDVTGAPAAPVVLAAGLSLAALVPYGLMQWAGAARGPVPDAAG